MQVRERENNMQEAQEAHARCEECGKTRGPDDDLEYSPVQVVFNTEVGWYSGGDGEFCGPCMAAIIAKANGR